MPILALILAGWLVPGAAAPSGTSEPASIGTARDAAPQHDRAAAMFIPHRALSSLSAPRVDDRPRADPDPDAPLTLPAAAAVVCLLCVAGIAFGRSSVGLHRILLTRASPRAPPLFA
jgi:hypothetical protein